ncbi:MAG: cytochrome b N-terminal domain-containing protein [Alphaproteobacteria bacterium]|nr:cytochrome b N-terminal domain-containing protein [Alphaproteobacteria bacterium]
MEYVRRPLRSLFLWLEAGLNYCFGTRLNPFAQLGALGFFFYWIVAVSGIYIYVFFDTGISEAYDSIEYMTNEQWYLAGVMRSLHRYASDGLIVVMLLHIAREFAFDRYRDSRWFTWITGVPILWLVYAAGIGGYWLVWDKLAQYIAIATTEWLDWLPIFGESIARNFLSPAHLDDRLFTLLIFLHIAVPLILLLVLWIHLQRIAKAKYNPDRWLAIPTFVVLMLVSILKPATSQGPADLATVPAEVGLDWFYLAAYPLLDILSAGEVWAIAFVLTLGLILLPFLPRKRLGAPAEVALASCNGCGRCVLDCPFNAISLQRRSDGRPFEMEAKVEPKLCVSCGICAGACPTAIPFRRASALVPGIELPDETMHELRERCHKEGEALSGPARVLLFGCRNGADVDRFRGDGVGVVRLPCIGMLPPSFIDYVLSRGVADGVVLAGCRVNTCHHRRGVIWSEARIAGERDPHLRARVPRERLLTCWAAATDRRKVERELTEFRERLAAMAERQDDAGPPPEAAPSEPMPVGGDDD